jgi:hypothetical protein
MDSLLWLASCLEQGRTAIAPALADAGQRGRIERLKHIGALAETRARTVICPWCEAHGVAVIAVDKAVCEDCGPIPLTVEHFRRLTPDGDWLRRRMSQALGLVDESAWSLVPSRVWRLGDVGRAGRRHRVLFGQRLGEVAVQRALLALWSTHIGDIPTILVATTAPERVYLPGVEVQLVPLPAAFRVRGDGLVADDAVWAGMQSHVPSNAGLSRRGPFSQDYSNVMLPGEAEPILLTRSQASLLRVLWEQSGVPIHREALIARSKLDLDKPVQAFPRPKYPDANRAYHILVRSNRQGYYWWAHEAISGSAHPGR